MAKLAKMMNCTASIKVIILILLQIAGYASDMVDTSSYQKENELVVLAHGLGSSDITMWLSKQRLEQANFDVCTIDVSHSAMRYNLEVAEQTIHFLQKGMFKR
ncbi:hypothetical protein [Ferrimonas lipolytica]|uniref:Uncharacterized protein n=1 Tax=Ferrimonas lipolytica TaxID=2724191 RepID=A0A6H1UCX2_9GAMM|nr:hypothetical protein [Ferrimonas lipolytica]QIZ76203.1 hypothetical protein HER31_04420 [Ferrimonas lipolytica]